MRKTVVGIVLLLLLVASVISSTIYQHYISEEMLTIIDGMSDIPSQDNAVAAKRVLSVWEQKLLIFELTMQSHEIDRISDAIRTLCILSETTNTSDYRIALDNARAWLEMIKESETFSFVGIL